MLRTELLTFIATIVICLTDEVALAKDQIKNAIALHGPTNILNYDDDVCKECGIVEWLKVTDPLPDGPPRRISSIR